MSGAIRALAAAEIRRLYRRPLAWAVLALGTVFMAVIFMLLLVRYLEHEAALRHAGVTAEILVRYFVAANLGVLLIAPLLTMGALAGDREAGMLRFFYSAPLGAFDLVAGKLLGVASLAGAYVAVAALIPLTLWWGAAIDAGVYLTNLLGLALFTLLHVALGIAASALARSPVAAALLALTVALLLWLADWANRLDPQSSVVGGWSTLARLRGFAQGLVVSADLAYFVAATVLCVVLATALVDLDRSCA